MTTADKPLFDEVDLTEDSLDDVVRRIAAQSDMLEEQTKQDLDGQYSLVEVEPKDNGHTLITLQDNDGNILVEDGLQNINWNALNDNTFETYKDFLKQAAEDPSTGGDAQDTILPIRSKTTRKTSSEEKITHFTTLAQRYIEENHGEVLAELLESTPAEVHVADDLQSEYNISPFNNEQRLGQLRSHIERHAPDLSPERSIELREASEAYRSAVADAIQDTPLDSTKAYFSEQFNYDNDDRSKKGIGSLAHDIIHWQLQNADDISAKAFTSAVKDHTYQADFDEITEETAVFLRGSDDWLLYGAAHDFFEENEALLDQYNATRDTVNGADPTAMNRVTNGAAMIEFPNQNHGSRQILRQLTRRNWLHDEYENEKNARADTVYAFNEPSQKTLTWHQDQSILNHVLNREQRYLSAIGTDIVEREAARLGDNYTNEELVQASLRAITEGVPSREQRNQVFTYLRNDNRPLQGPSDTDEPHDNYLVQSIGAQLLANATIRAQADDHNIDDPLRTYNS